jgi:hypothetical protein
MRNSYSNRIRSFVFAVIAVPGIVRGAEPAAMPTPEQALETGTATVVLPRTPGSAIVTRRCGDCPVLTLRLTDSARLFVGKQQMTLAEFIRFVDGLNTDRRLTIFYDNKSHHITRLIVAAELRVPS